MPTTTTPTALPRSKLYVKAIDLLRNRPITKTLKVIERDTGLSEAWLSLILTREQISPSCDRVEVLYEYLSGKQLEL